MPDISERLRVVVITGASAGVGRATALRFARPGISLALLARDLASLEEVKAELESRGATAIAIPLDVSDADAVFAAAARIEAQIGPIDVWINNAMVTVFSPISISSAAEIRRVTEVTYLGYVNGTLAALNSMRRRNQGHIIQVGSGLAYRGIPLQAAYCGAKFAIRGFTDSLRTELLHEGSAVQTTILEIPAVNTPQFDWARSNIDREPQPVPPVVQPEVIANAIYHAAIKPRREYWVGWTTAAMIFANMLLPDVVGRYLSRKAWGAQMGKRITNAARRDNLDRPVPALHAIHGRFGGEARTHALLVDADRARLGAVFAGAAIIFGLGLLVGGAKRR